MPTGEDVASAPADGTSANIVKTLRFLPSGVAIFGTGLILWKFTAKQAKDFIGEVSEWSKVQHWKCCVRKRTQGSNPCLSAICFTNPDRILLRIGIFFGLLPRIFPAKGWVKKYFINNFILYLRQNSKTLLW